MFDIGFAELVIIALLGLVILGPERLPEATKTIFRWVHNLKRISSEVQNSVEKELNIGQLKQDMHLEDIDRQLQSIKNEVQATGNELNRP